MRSVELFSGCGGLALGLSRAGFQHELMAEWNEDACATIWHNKGKGLPHVHEWPCLREDVRLIDWGRISGEVDLLAGGPPCQPFSIGGRHAGDTDSRDMWPEAIRAVRELNPKAFLFENVRGLSRPAFKEYFEWIQTHLARPHLTRGVSESHQEHTERLKISTGEAIYDVVVGLVNTADYGVPQKRHRLIVAGIRRDLGVNLSLPSPSHSRERLLWDQWVTGDYWLRHNLQPPADELIGTTDRSTVARLRRSGVRPIEAPWVTVRDITLDLGAPNGLNNHLFQDGARVYPGHTGSPLDQPAKALKAGGHGVPGGENMIVRDDGTVRYFSVREAARLQCLPDEYEFPCSWTESMRQLGNAVPVKLAEVMGQAIADLLRLAEHQRQQAA